MLSYLIFDAGKEILHDQAKAIRMSCTSRSIYFLPNGCYHLWSPIDSDFKLSNQFSSGDWKGLSDVLISYDITISDQGSREFSENDRCTERKITLFLVACININCLMINCLMINGDFIIVKL